MTRAARIKKEEGLQFTKCGTTQNDVSLQIPKATLIDDQPCLAREAIDSRGKIVAIIVAAGK